jgi:hypothetical protein
MTSSQSASFAHALNFVHHPTKITATLSTHHPPNACSLTRFTSTDLSPVVFLASAFCRLRVSQRNSMLTSGTSTSSPSLSSHATTMSKCFLPSGMSSFATVCTRSETFLSILSLCLGKMVL